MSIAELIDQLGITEIALEFGHTNITTVASWKYRNSIPVAHWPALIAYANARGVQICNDDLVAAHLFAKGAENGDAA